jgi:hypothetical protein
MNIGGRFQYPIAPLVLISGWLFGPPDLLGTVGRRRAVRASLTTAAVLIAVSALAVRWRLSLRLNPLPDGRYDVGRVLRDYRDRGYTLVTTEAGLLPFESRWRAIDAWGLNDFWIATHGGITLEYLERNRPALLLVRTHVALDAAFPAPGENDWDRMVSRIREYARIHGFRTIAAYGVEPTQLHVYYCAPDMPECDAIAAGIRSINYAWYGTTLPVRDFAH